MPRGPAALRLEKPHSYRWEAGTPWAPPNYLWNARALFREHLQKQKYVCWNLKTYVRGKMQQIVMTPALLCRLQCSWLSVRCLWRVCEGTWEQFKGPLYLRDFGALGLSLRVYFQLHVLCNILWYSRSDEGRSSSFVSASIRTCVCLCVCFQCCAKSFTVCEGKQEN